jgi:hypothetical protein
MAITAILARRAYGSNEGWTDGCATKRGAFSMHVMKKPHVSKIRGAARCDYSGK